MTEQFFDGYSQYELQALKIPSEVRGKCLKQLVNYTLCNQRTSPVRAILSNPCEDELARFDRCHQKEVNYASGGVVGNMMYNNPSLFRELGVSETYEKYLATPTPLNFHR